MGEPSPFGAFLRERRMRAGRSARAVAGDLGLSHVAYGNVERGRQAVLAERYWPALLELYPDVTREELRLLHDESETTIEVDLSGLAGRARRHAHELVNSLNRLSPEDIHRLVAVLEGSDGRITPSILDERVPRVPPMSKQDLVELADELLRVLQPDALEDGGPVNVVALISDGGPIERELGIEVYRAEPGELAGEASAFADYILIRKDQWDKLHNGGRSACRPRATVAHELGHAVLHSAYLQKSETAKRTALVPRRDLKAYEDPEWQAWTLAQAFLIPIRVARTLEDKSAENLAERFQVSTPFAEGYLRRFGAWLETS